MSLVSVYIREQQRYTRKELSKIFKYDETTLTSFLKNLKSFGVLKSVKNMSNQKDLSDLVDSDIEYIDEQDNNSGCLYVFTFVGIILCGDRVLKVFPKYILDKNAQPLEHMTQVIKVLEKYNNSDEQIISLYNGQGQHKKFNLLPLILFLLRDYFEYGLYSNQEEIRELNGEGDILWQKTIDECFAFISNNRPYYVDTYTRKITNNDYDYFSRLHAFVISECSRQIRSAELDHLLGVETVDLSFSTIDDFGGKEIILDRIYKELNVQFNTRKQILLKSIYSYILHDNKLMEDPSGFSMYGTTSFHAVWEKMCSEVFDNKLHYRLNELNIKNLAKKDISDSTKLIEIIQKPEWHRDYISKNSPDTLIPDIVSLYSSESKSYFIIFDAKYYNIKIDENELSGTPGVGDITKQYLYQLAFKDITKDFDSVINCFLFPTEDNSIKNYGYARMQMLNDLNLENIQIRLLPCSLINKYYLENKKLDISLLKLDGL